MGMRRSVLSGRLALPVGWRAPESGLQRRQRCSDVDGSGAKRVLLVGAERPDEFRDARRLLLQGHDVAVVNPRMSRAARLFRAEGGRFMSARVDQLPAFAGQFDLICENYPYPSGRHFVPARLFALARLARLARGGRWVLFTESPRYARELKAAVENGPHGATIRVRLSRVAEELAPASSYPPVSTRFRLIFLKRP
jgi:transposase